MRRLADLYALKSMYDRKITDGRQSKVLMGKCYELLIDAYIHYRNNFELHGIADVLCSMKCAEIFEYGHQTKGDGKHRSSDSFVKLAKDLYEYLGDECGWYVSSQIL